MPPARHWSEPGDDRGSAALEFILVGLILLVPLVYLVTVLGIVQGQALGAEAGARHLARTIATSSGASDARERSNRVVDSVVAQYGLDPAAVGVQLECRPAGTPCPAAGATLTVTVSSRVRLPLVPEVLGWERAVAVPIEATAVQRVSRFWSAP
ncbi:TadE family protein [Microbacterium aureliae]